MAPQTKYNRLQQWINGATAVLKQYNINLLTQGTRLSLENDRRETEGYLVVITERPPVSVVLGMRNQENGGGREAFFCLVNGTWQSLGKELATVTYSGNNRYTQTENWVDIWVTPSETCDWNRSMEWIQQILTQLKERSEPKTGKLRSIL